MLYLTMDADRQAGTLKGAVTSTYFRDAIKNGLGQLSDVPIFTKALDYLLARESGHESPQATTARAAAKPVDLFG